MLRLASRSEDSIRMPTPRQAAEQDLFHELSDEDLSSLDSSTGGRGACAEDLEDYHRCATLLMSSHERYKAAFQARQNVPGPAGGRGVSEPSGRDLQLREVAPEQLLDRFPPPPSSRHRADEASCSPVAPRTSSGLGELKVPSQEALDREALPVVDHLLELVEAPVRFLEPDHPSCAGDGLPHQTSDGARDQVPSATRASGTQGRILLIAGCVLLWALLLWWR